MCFAGGLVVWGHLPVGTSPAIISLSASSSPVNCPLAEPRFEWSDRRSESIRAAIEIRCHFDQSDRPFWAWTWPVMLMLSNDPPSEGTLLEMVGMRAVTAIAGPSGMLLDGTESVATDEIPNQSAVSSLLTSNLVCCLYRHRPGLVMRQ
jgi:hypothetical protein